MEKLKVPRGKKSKKEKSANRKPSGTVKGDERVSNYDKVMTTGKYSDIERDNEIEATEIPLQEQNLLKERDLHPHATSVVSRLKKNLNYIENGMYQKGQESPELQTKLGSSLSLGKKDGGTTKEYFVNKLSKDGKSSQSSTSNWTDPGSAHSSGILLPPQPEQVLAQDRFVPEILHERTESVSNHSPGRLPKAVSPKSHTRNKARTSCQNNNGSKKSQEDNEKTSTSVEGKTSEIMVSSAREVMKVKPKGLTEAVEFLGGGPWRKDGWMSGIGLMTSSQTSLLHLPQIAPIQSLNRLQLHFTTVHFYYGWERVGLEFPKVVLGDGIEGQEESLDTKGI
ncbi:uncharacterized protein LOC143032305 isoform X1 [Oratosquilla oratoria]|uniref:uncharacterized protein LOC143032305 isoform X1 n=1 Tax=Oratosquilla oratoria TaxID=337810 RepID=UPI003F75F3E1